MTRYRNGTVLVLAAMGLWFIMASPVQSAQVVRGGVTAIANGGLNLVQFAVHLGKG